MVHFGELLKKRAHQLGFELVGIAPAGEADDFCRLQDWLAQGFAGSMEYLHRQEAARRHPASILPQVKSVVMVGLNYFHGPPQVQQVRVAQYARGEDYHAVLRDKLNSLLDWVQEQKPGTLGRGVVDTAPLLERGFARRAGLGWIGKNTMLIHKRLGSFFFLGALLLDLELPPDAPFESHHCGSCTACLDACPTNAFRGPFQLDARQCISYLTIELRGPIPMELREGIGLWLFGCDICQDVCPWNRKAPRGKELRLEREDWIDPQELLVLSVEEFRTRFKGTALWRTKRQGLFRNAAIVLGNSKDPAVIPVLQKARTDEDPVIREAVEWAIRKISDGGIHLED